MCNVHNDVPIVMIKLMILSKRHRDGVPAVYEGYHGIHNITIKLDRYTRYVSI